MHKQLENPNYEEFYIETNGTECNRVFKMSKKVGEKLVVHLHSKECWYSNPCQIKYVNDPQGNPTRDKDGIVHGLVHNYISYSTVDWDQLYIMMVGFDLERL